MAARMEMERLGLGRLERLDLRSFWGEQLPDLTPWFVHNVDLLGQTLGIDITPMQREVDNGAFNVLGTDALGRPIVIENRLEEADQNHLGQLILHASTLESAVVVWVSPRFDQEFRRTLEWLNDRTDSKIDFFGVELGLVRIGRSLPAPVLDVVVQPRNWRKASRRQGPLGSVPTAPPPPPAPPPTPPPAATAPPPPPAPPPAPASTPLPAQPAARDASHIPTASPPGRSASTTWPSPPTARCGPGSTWTCRSGPRPSGCSTTCSPSAWRSRPGSAASFPGSGSTTGAPPGSSTTARSVTSPAPTSSAPRRSGRPRRWWR